jgi:hypothetical protein
MTEVVVGIDVGARTQVWLRGQGRPLISRGIDTHECPEPPELFASRVERHWRFVPESFDDQAARPMPTPGVQWKVPNLSWKGVVCRGAF